MGEPLTSRIARRLAAGEEEGAALVLEEASRADEARLDAFLAAVELRLDRHPEPLRAEELRALLRAAG